MATQSNHWGEFEEHQSGLDDWSLSPNDLEELLIPQPLRPSPPSLFQPSQEETASFQILPTEMCQFDPLVLHTIKLLQYQRQLLQLLARAQTYGDISTAAAPFPEDPQIERKAAKHHYLNFLPPNVTLFTSGANKSQKFEIEETTARLILRKAVATMCAHVGYSDTHESVLRVLTDITHDFMTKLTQTLRTNMDNLLLTGNCPFHDVVEQTLHVMGMGGMASLHNMYRDRVIMYHARVRQRTMQLHHQYQAFLHHASSASSRRESTTETTNAEETLHTSSTSTVGGLYQSIYPEESSIASVKSTSSVEPDGSLHSVSTQSQTGVDGDEGGQTPPATQIQVYAPR